MICVRSYQDMRHFHTYVNRKSSSTPRSPLTCTPFLLWLFWLCLLMKVHILSLSFCVRLSCFQSPYIYIYYIYMYVCVCGFISTFMAKGCNGVDVRNGISLIQHSFSLPQICHRIRHGSRHTCVVLRLVRHKKTFDTIMPGVTQKHMAPHKMSYPKHQMPLPHQSFAHRGSCATQQSWTPNRV